MSSSKIIKSAVAGRALAEPLKMENLGGRSVSPANKGIVGGDIVVAEREAYEAGFKAGEKAGFELGRQKAQMTFTAISGILSELNSFKEGLHRSCEKEIVDLCLAIARKVLQREVEARPEVVLDCARAGLKAVVAAGEILIRVNPKDLHVLHENIKELTKYGDGFKGIKIEGDEAVERGGCVIETNYGEVDATISGILSDIEEKLKDAYSG
jgi:flagellar assembly protein FliH